MTDAALTISMGLLNLFGIFEKKATAKPQKVAAEIVQEAFEKIGAKEQNIWHKDHAYTYLPEKEMRDLVFKYHDTSKDDTYEKDVMDCDDFAILAQASVIRGQKKEGYEAPVIFGKMDFKRKDLGWHMVNVTVTNEGTVMLYDPQTKKWTGDTSNIESIRHVEF